MTAASRPTRYRSVSEEARSLLQIGESGRCEFKRDVNAVNAKTLAALANWVALEPSSEVAHLLVGVEEQTDDETGLVIGKPYGLRGGLDKAVSRLQDVASATLPIPVELFIVEEAVNDAVPFLRVEIRPTMPPHYDSEGRRQTRQGRSTRHLTDEELLTIYLDREAGSFAARFRHTAGELREAVGAVGTQVEQIGDAIESTIAQPLQELTDAAEFAGMSASAAESAASDVSDDVVAVTRLVRQLQDVVEDIQENSAGFVVDRVAHTRRLLWWWFTVDTGERVSKPANRLRATVEEILSRDIELNSEHNLWEICVWQGLLNDRKALRNGKGTLRWWQAAVEEVLTFQAQPVFDGPDLPDFRSELRGGLPAALANPDSVISRFRAEVRRMER